MALILSAAWTSQVSGEVIQQTPGIGYTFDSDTNTYVATMPDGSVSFPAIFDVLNSTSTQYTVQFTTSGSITNDTFPDWSIAINGTGAANTSTATPGPWQNGSILNITQAADLTWSNAYQVGSGAIFANTTGGDGYTGSENFPTQNPPAMAGGAGGPINITQSGNILVTGGGSGVGDADLLSALAGIYAYSLGQNGQNYQAHDTAFAGDGGAGGTVTINTVAGSMISMANTGNTNITTGILAASQGGLPGVNGGVNYFYGASGLGGAVNIDHQGTIQNSADAAVGILATSIGGAGGTVAYQDGVMNTYYAESAPGGAVNVNVDGTISITGAQGMGIFAASTAGASAIYADANYSVIGQNVTISIGSDAMITTGSQGGDGTTYGIGVLGISSGTSTVLLPFSTQTVSTSGSGKAGDVSITNAGQISTQGEMAIGIAALGVGGAGVVGAAAQEGISILGNSDYVYSAQGSTVTVDNSGQITTLGATAHGIVAHSSGGGGLLRVTANPFTNEGVLQGGAIIGAQSTATTGADVSGYNAGTVSVTHSGSITTGNGQGGGKASSAIIAQAIGGSGGTAGGQSHALFIGDSGGQGGDGGEVSVTLLDQSIILTRDINSPGVIAHSIGGGGGNASNGIGIFVATGGQGGSGGDGKTVTIDLNQGGSISTLADYSSAILAQSIGGGGGNGGGASSVGFFIGAAVGGLGGNGGDGGEVNATLDGTILTTGNQSMGLLAHSVGGGGGSGGASRTVSAGVVFSMGIAVGGAGGDGGNGGTINALNTGSITTGLAQDPAYYGLNPYGADSHGVLVQSIGGGGGHGGAATATSFTFPNEEIPISIGFDLTLGGSGGVGGDGGDVSALNAGATSGTQALIITYADGSHGMAAQSIGGGGGNGGDSTASSYLINSGTVGLKVAVAHGGDGGSGGSGGTVQASNGIVPGRQMPASGDGVINTFGQNAVGLFAHSIGGGGGNGGAGNASTSTPPTPSGVADAWIGKQTSGQGEDSDDSFSLSIALGMAGSGGSGNAGGDVSVFNAAGSQIQTRGSGAQGIVAQSISGGGGYSGGAASSGSGDDVDINLAIGASGGSGDAGGSVTVTNNGLITTRGGDAHGILTQSIGGGGGYAGSTDASATINYINEANDILKPPNNSYSADISIGGSGGAGGIGGSVTVTNTAGSYDPTIGSLTPGIQTQGIRAFGILAQSIGGGGGSGGAASSTSNSAVGIPGDKGGTYNVSVSLGGTGGIGGDGGSVSVANSGLIQTQGYGGHGIVAHSIGAGGGVGGEGTVDSTTTLGLGAAITQDGQANGSGGEVSITNTGWIFTSGQDATGILAQSIGGGGGLASSGNNSFTTSIPEASIGVAYTLGSNAGVINASDGGTVAVSSSHAIITTGDWSHGILAQSIGGSGGKVSSVYSDSATPALSMTVGMYDVPEEVSGGNGGEVTTTLNNATIITGYTSSPDSTPTPAGYSGYGLLLQSIAGGGGLASDGSLSATNGTNADISPTYQGGAGFGGIQVGWQGSGQGGNVTLTGADSSGTITSSSVSTFGEAAHAVVLQSIGGSGGIGGQGNSLSTTSGSGGSIRLSVGGQNGRPNISPGGSVTIQDIILTARTTGDNAYGILAQSIGGGGGLGFAPNGASAGVFLGNGGAGDGGSVTLALAEGSSITTSGDGAHAMVAQSIGGGGGIAHYTQGEPSLSLSIPDSNSFVASNGNGGQLSITSYDISTTGAGAHGILAQSIGGGGGLLADGAMLYAVSTGVLFEGVSPNGSDIIINQNGTLNASGTNSIGIFAQSNGMAGGDDITLNINGDVIGGSGAQGAGILVAGGSANNTITIADGASVSTVAGQSGMAIAYEGTGLLNVTNNGTVIGSISLTNANGTPGTFVNNSANTLLAGPVIAADVINNGRFSTALRPGQGFQQVHVQGDFVQTSQGILEINADYLSSQSDQLRVDGNTTLNGSLRVNASSVLPGQLPNILLPGGPVSGQLTSDITTSPLIRYTLSPGGSLSADASFAPASMPLATNQQAVASHLQSTWDSGGSTALAPTYAALNNQAAAGPAAYSQTLAQLSPGAVLGLGARRLDNLLTFTNHALNGTHFRGSSLYLEETPGVWYNSSGYSARQTDTNGLPSYRLNHVVQQIGGQFAGEEGWFFGGAGAYAYDWISDSASSITANGEGAMFTGFAKYQNGPWLLTGAAFASFGFYESERTINLPTGSLQAQGSPAIYSGGGLLSVAYSFEFESLYLRPSLGLGVVTVHSAGYTESGAGALSLKVNPATQTTFVASPAVELGTRWDLSDTMTLRPALGLGLLILSNDTWQQNASLVGAPAGTPTFTTSIPTDHVAGRVSAGLTLQIDNQWALSLNYGGEFSQSITSQGGSFNANWSF